MKTSLNSNNYEEKVVQQHILSMRLMHRTSNISVMMQSHKPSNNYDQFQCPPDLNAAKDHGQSRRVCRPQIYMKNGQKRDQIGSGSSINDEAEVEQSKISQILGSKKLCDQQQQEGLENIVADSLCQSELLASPIGSKGKPSFSFIADEVKCGQTKGDENSSDCNRNRKCPCCGFYIENELIAINCNNIDFLHLGITYPLYFDFIKQCALLLCLHFIISSIPAIIINSRSNECTNFDSSFVCHLSFLNILHKDGEKSKQMSSLGLQNLCNMIFMLVSMVVISIYKIQQKVKKEQLDTFHCSISDFSIFVTRLPKHFQMKDLEDFLRFKLEKRYTNFDRKNEFSIVKSYKLYDLKVYANLYESQCNLSKIKIKTSKELHVLRISQAKYARNTMSQDSFEVLTFTDRDKSLKQRLITKGDCVDIMVEKKSGQKRGDRLITKKQEIEYKRLVNQIDILERELKKIESELNNTNKDLASFEIVMLNQLKNDVNQSQNIKFSKRVIITFNEYEVADKVRKSFKMSFKEKCYFYFRFFMPSMSRIKLSDYYFRNTLIKVKKAPEPTDVLWTNIGSTRKKWKFIIASHFIIYFIMLVSFLVLLLLKKSIKQEQNQQSGFVSLLLSFTASTVVALFNSLLGIVIRKGASYEEHNVQTKFFVSVGKKLTKMFIANMVISTLLSNMVYYYISDKNQFPFDAQGLMNDFFFLFITNSYIGSIFNVFDIMWGYRLIKRSRAEKDCSTMTQMEANSLFEGHPIDMALRYANINKTVLFTASVSPFIPIGVPLSIVGLVITYWVDKYLLLRRYVCKNYLSFDLAKSMLNSFKIYVVYFSFGNMLTMFMPVSYQESNDKDISHFVWPERQKSFFFYLSIFGFLLALAYRYSPLKGISDLYNCIFKEQYTKKQILKKYEEIQDDLHDDYGLYHPIFKDNSKHLKVQDNGGQQSSASSLLKQKKHSTILDYSQMLKSIQNQVEFNQMVK